MKGKNLSALGLAALLLLSLLSACGGTAPEPGHKQEQSLIELEPVPLSAGEKLKVVATTNIVGDVVRQVGGDRIELTTLMGIGIDPHSYVPTPTDTAAIYDAHLVFANGAGLEADLGEMFDSAGGDAVQIHLSDGLALRPADETSGESSDQHEHGGESGNTDPHVWLDVENVQRWVARIEEALSSLDPANAEGYRANAEAYTSQLQELDAWVVEQVASIPEANRKLVTNHPAFAYFAARYGLEQVGAVYPVSPSAEPSAGEIAALEDAIREYDVPAVFTESTVNPELAQQVAKDTGIELVALYSGSLGEPGSRAESYVLMIHYDVDAIVGALK